MAQVLIRNLADDVVRRLKASAAQENVSLEEKLRTILIQAVRPSREELIEEAARIRAMSPYSDIDSTDLIREDRDNDEPYR